MAQQPTMDWGLLSIKASRSHSDTSHSVGFLWASDQLDAETSLPDNKHHPKERGITAPVGIRIHNPRKRAPSDPCPMEGGC